MRPLPACHSLKLRRGGDAAVAGFRERQLTGRMSTFLLVSPTQSMSDADTALIRVCDMKLLGLKTR